MTETFTASNGSEVYIERGEVFIGNPPLSPLTKAGVQALREFFQHERDKALGRWRWPENPDYVVYLDKAECYIDQPAVIVVNEADGGTAYCGREGLHSASGIGARDKWCEPAAAAYFAAHPEPKPWHDAKPGEVWVLTTGDEGEDHAWFVDPDFGSLRFVYAGGLSNLPTDHPDIVHGRRIWPEVA